MSQRAKLTMLMSLLVQVGVVVTAGLIAILLEVLKRGGSHSTVIVVLLGGVVTTVVLGTILGVSLLFRKSLRVPR